MRKVKDILCLQFINQLSPRAIARLLSTSRGGVLQCLQRFNESGLIWQLPDGVSGVELDDTLYKCNTSNIHNSRTAQLHTVLDWFGRRLCRCSKRCIKLNGCSSFQTKKMKKFKSRRGAETQRIIKIENR